MNIRSLITLLLLFTTIRLPAAPVTLQSSTYQAGLVELYTSEGCSSCPPADRWLNALKSQKGLWQEFVPLAFHVDYWDYIGWKDRFATSEYSKRQQLHAGQGNVGTVYTPAILVNGQEWRSWRFRKKPTAPSRKNVGILKLDIENGLTSARFKPTENVGAAYQLNLALLGFDLSTHAKAGENSGRRLNHEFVVLGSKTTPLVVNNGEYLARLEIPEPHTNAPVYGIAAWVTAPGQLRPVQAAGGWLPEQALVMTSTGN